MRFGLTTPVLTLTPRGHAPWEADAGPAEIVEIAQAADRLGFHHLTCSDHVAIPEPVAPARGSRYYDPLATFGHLSALTERIRFATHVLVLPYHHPMEVAKRYGTLDLLSGGRLILGIGVGSLEEEFDLLGADFAGRGPIFEDSLRALRAIFARRLPTYRGSTHHIEGFVVDPCGIQERVPIWIGGRSERSLRRALLFADGWDPFRYTREEIVTLLARAREWPAWRERVYPLEIVLSPDRIFDVTTGAGRDGMQAEIASYREAGATVLNLRFRSRSAAHFVEALEVFAERIAPEWKDG